MGMHIPRFGVHAVLIALTAVFIVGPVYADYESSDYVLDSAGWRSVPADSEASNYTLSGSVGFGQNGANTSADALHVGNPDQAMLPTPPAPILSVVATQSDALHLVVRIGDNDPYVQIQVTLTDANQAVVYVAPSGLVTDAASWNDYVAWGSTEGKDITALTGSGYVAQVRVRADDFSISDWSVGSVSVTPLRQARVPVLTPLVGTHRPPTIGGLIDSLHAALQGGTALSIAKSIAAVMVPLTALALVSQIATMGGLALQMLFELADRLLGSLLSSLQFLTFYRKRRVFGVVYDGITRQPLPDATVEILSPDTRRLLDTQTTNEKGQYYFLDDARTSYLLRVSHPRFTLFEQTVRGRVNIPVYLGLQLEYNPLELQRRSLRGAWFDKINAVRIWLLLFGTIAWATLFVGEYQGITGYVLGVYYILAWSLELYVRRQPRPYGVVIDSVTKAPLGLVVVRITNQDGKLISTLVCDESGRFKTWLQPGIYTFALSEAGYVPTKLDAMHINRSLKSLEVTAQMQPQYGRDTVG